MRLLPSLGSLCVVAFCTLAVPAYAHDLLPLLRGIYVDAAVPCKVASNATMLSYWGNTNGINDAEDDCTIKTYHIQGVIYDLSRTCKQIESSGEYTDNQKLTVIDKKKFVMGGQTYRYCGPSVDSFLQ